MKNTVMENDKYKFAIRRITASRKAMIISGTVCAVPFVFEGLFLLSWFMYIPIAIMFFERAGSIKKEAARIFLFGYSYYFIGYFWISELYPMDFVGFNGVQSVLIIIFALTAIPSIHSGMLTLCYAVCKMLSRKVPEVFKLFVFPCIFVFSEYVQSLGALAFPWCRVPVAQAGCNAIIQSASLFGSYFVTYIVLIFNALIAYSLINRKLRKMLVISAVTLFCTNMIFGIIRISILEKQMQQSENFTAIALQGNIPSSEKWIGSSQDMVDLYMQLADSAVKKARTNGYEENTVILIPETALPFTLREGGRTAVEIAEFAEENGVCFAAGAFSEQENMSGNSIFIFTPDGKMSRPYSKRHLVPFGEYLPYRPFFELFIPALAEINILSSDLYEASETALFELPFAKAGTLICYESIFPELCRQSVLDGAEIILVSTNDSWFGSSSALRHHLANARLRAIENNVPVIRAANTGISAIIQPDGSVVDTLEANERGFIVNQLVMGVTNTLYHYIGDLWLVICLVLLIVSSIIQTKYAGDNNYEKIYP